MHFLPKLFPKTRNIIQTILNRTTTKPTSLLYFLTNHQYRLINNFFILLNKTWHSLEKINTICQAIKVTIKFLWGRFRFGYDLGLVWLDWEF